jgi:hypothetical protein
VPGLQLGRRLLQLGELKLDAPAAGRHVRQPAAHLLQQLQLPLVGIVEHHDRLTAEQNLRFHAVLYHVPAAEVEERIDRVLRLVALEDRRHDLELPGRTLADERESLAEEPRTVGMVWEREAIRFFRTRARVLTGVPITAVDTTIVVLALLRTFANVGMPGWPVVSAGRRVLVERRGWVDDDHVAALRSAAKDVRQCPGPSWEAGRACPLVTSGRCRLAEEADLIVSRLPATDPDCAAVLAAHRRRWPRRLAQ